LYEGPPMVVLALDPAMPIRSRTRQTVSILALGRISPVVSDAE
jgi:hypothetical protein